MEMYFKGNKKMNQIVQAAKKQRTDFEIRLNVIAGLFNTRIVKIHDAHILEHIENSVPDDFTKESFEKSILIHSDLTSYECSANEIKLMDNFENENFKLSSAEQFILGKLLMENLITKNNFPFPAVVYFTYDDEDLFMRFHKYRSEEGYWISTKLEEYEESLGYYFIHSEV